MIIIRQQKSHAQLTSLYIINIVGTTNAAATTQFTIPANSIIYTNLWSAGRDPAVWTHPDVFDPDRFLAAPGSSWCDRHTDSDSPINRHLAESCCPFGVGRRRCVGEPLGRLQVFVFFVVLMYRCRVSLTEGGAGSGRVHCRGADQDDEEYGDVVRPRPFTIHIEKRLRP